MESDTFLWEGGGGGGGGGREWWPRLLGAGHPRHSQEPAGETLSPPGRLTPAATRGGQAAGRS